MKEDFLHFIWMHRLFDATALCTTDGEQVGIQAVGRHNHSSGPDFSEACITIGDTLWAGSVEIHLRSSDWDAHQHQVDTAYNNVVLHVVYEHDQEVTTAEGRSMPTLELRGRIKAAMIDHYQRLTLEQKVIACEAHLPGVPAMIWNAWLDRLLVHRLERKAKDIHLILKASKGDWLQCYGTALAGYLAGQWNKLAMMELARKVPVQLLARYRDLPEVREAMLLGVGGFLVGPSVPVEFKQVFELRKKVHGLQSVHQQWKTGRLRPHQMPVHRIVQFAAMSVFLESAMHALLDEGEFDWAGAHLQPSAYWADHLTFSDARSATHQVSEDLQLILAINVHAPLLFAYAQSTGDERYKIKAIESLGKWKPETNSITKMWAKKLRKPMHAGDSQALIELKTQFCDLKKCVNCSIGKRIIQGA